VNIPKTIVLGDTISWKDAATKDNLGAPVDSSAYTLIYAIRSASKAMNLTATADGSGWKTSIAISDWGTGPTAIPAGDYTYQAYAVDNPTTPTKKVTLGSGALVVQENYRAQTTYDGKSQIQKDLEAVQAAMRALISGGAIQAYTIGTRQIHRMTIADLRVLESKLKMDLAMQKFNEGSGPNPRKTLVRF
jgi:hypothetical protein